MDTRNGYPRHIALSKLTWFLLLCLLLGTEQVGATLRYFTSDVRVDDGEWGYFNCTISCTHSLYWYVGGGSISSRRLAHFTVNKFMQKNIGFEIELVNMNGCSDGADEYTQELGILTTAELDGTPVQCSAVPTSSNDQQFFSRYSVLHVEAPDPVSPPSPSPTPSSSGGCPTLLCPAPSPPASPTPSTPSACPTPSQVTVTETVATTIIITPSSTPDVDNIETARSARSTASSTSSEVRLHPWVSLVLLSLISVAIHRLV